MAYCTIENVEVLTEISWTDATSPTTTQVESMIDNVANEIDGVLQASGYSVPVSGTAALELLRSINAFGVGPEAYHATYLVESLPPKVKYWQDRYDKFLASVRAGEVQLPALEPESDIDAAWGIAPSPQREDYWLTNEALTN